MNAINEVIEAKGLSLLELKNRMNEAGYKITYPTLLRLQGDAPLPDYMTKKQMTAIARASGIRVSELLEIDESHEAGAAVEDEQFPFKKIRNEMGFTAQQVADKTGFKINSVFKAEQHGRAGIKYKTAFLKLMVTWFEKK